MGPIHRHRQRSSSGTPSGSVQFEIDGVDFGSPVTLVSGSASFSTTTLTATSHDITAIYTPDSSSFTGSQNDVPQSVGTATPTVVATDAGGPYTGNPFPASATATGIGGASVSGSFTYTYYVGSNVRGPGSRHRRPLPALTPSLPPSRAELQLRQCVEPHR